MESNAPCLHNDATTGRCYNTVVEGSGYCRTHKKAFEFSNWGVTKPKNWRHLSESVIRRDRGVCYLCGQPGADAAEHVKPKSEGGTDAMHNLKAVHHNVAPYCHRAKTAAEGNRAKAQKYQAKRRGR